MRRPVFFVLSAGLVCGVLLSGKLPTANAIPPFKKQFDALYVKKDSSDPADQAFAQAVKKAKCNVCHIPKKKKHFHNAYGDELAKLLDKKKDAKNPEKIKEALKKVGAMKIDPNDPNSPTWDELFKQGKLPGDLSK